MTIASVSLTNTFDEWRTRTNQVITFVNDFESINLRATSDKTNVVFTQSNSIYGLLNVAWAQANTGYLQANDAYSQANTARDHANAAFAKANTATVPAFDQANAAFIQANVGFTQANTARTHANSAYLTANSGYDQANTARIHANVSYLQANTARDHANVSYGQANTARDHANVSYAQADTGRDHANVSFAQANTARIHANAAFAAANAAGSYSLTTSDLLGGAAGSVVYQDGINSTAFLGAGTSGQALVTKGAGAAPIWANIIPAGTVMLFVQTAAPTGWTKSTTYNDRALRVVNGAVGAGGSLAFSTAFASRSFSGTTSATGVAGYTDYRTVTGTVGATTLSTSQIPAHRHYMFYPSDLGSATALTTSNFASRSGSYGSNGSYTIAGIANDATIGLTGSSGGNGSHDHSFSGGSHQHYFDAGTHSHSFSSSIDMTVQYVDAIIASKDAY